MTNSQSASNDSRANRVDYALSENKTTRGWQDVYPNKVEEYKDQVFSFDGGAHVLLRFEGYDAGILSMLEGVCKEKASTTMNGWKA